MTEEGVASILEPSTLGPIDKDQFSFAFDLAMRAGHLSMPVENPEQYGVNLVDDDSGEVTGLRFTDNPMNRAIFAVKQHFGDDHQQLLNFTMRFFALMDIFRKNAVAEWIKDDLDNPRAKAIHPAVIYAAAEVKLNKKGDFPLKKFLARVKEIAHTQIEDEDSEEP